MFWVCLILKLNIDESGLDPAADPSPRINSPQKGTTRHRNLQRRYLQPHLESIPNDSKLEAPKVINKSNSENSLNNVNLADSVLPDQVDNPAEVEKAEEA